MAPEMIDKCPVVPARPRRQGPELQGEGLHAPCPLPQVHETLADLPAVGRVIEHGPEEADERPVMGQLRPVGGPNGVGPVQRLAPQAGDKGRDLLPIPRVRAEGGKVELQLEQEPRALGSVSAESLRKAQLNGPPLRRWRRWQGHSTRVECRGLLLRWQPRLQPPHSLDHLRHGLPQGRDHAPMLMDKVAPRWLHSGGVVFCQRCVEVRE